MSFVVLVSLVLSAALFAWSGGSKVAGPRRWREVLGRYRFGPLTPVLAVGVPVLEVGIAVTLVTGGSRVGSAAMLASLAGFSMAVLRLRRLEGNRLPCGCFGRTTSRDFRSILVRNAVLALAAVPPLIHDRDVSVMRELGWPSGGEALPALAAVVGIAIMVWMISVTSSAFRAGAE